MVVSKTVATTGSCCLLADFIGATYILGKFSQVVHGSGFDSFWQLPHYNDAQTLSHVTRALA